MFWSSPAMGSDQQCKDLALAWLKIYALESYDFSFDSINYPWLDAGGIVRVLEPNRLSIDPTNFLLSSVTIPLTLGPMSLSANRITFVKG
jgi:hypothetical protein